MTRLSDLYRELRIAWLGFRLNRARAAAYELEWLKTDLSARYHGEINMRSPQQWVRMQRVKQGA